MKDDRQKLIVEIAGLAGLVSTLPPEFQAHMQGMAADMIADPDYFNATLKTHGEKRETSGGVSDEVRNKELGMPEPGVESRPFFRNFTRLLAPLADKMETRQKLDMVIGILCAEIVHRREWDKQMLDNDHTLPFLKACLG